jgi:hypothetical protein
MYNDKNKEIHTKHIIMNFWSGIMVLNLHEDSKSALNIGFFFPF